MKPTKRKISYEKVTTGMFIAGEITDIQYDMEHVFKGHKGYPDKTAEAVRFVFKLKGYAFNHYSRWLKFSYGEKSTLYKKYLTKLVDGIYPDADFDLDVIKGMSVKTIWKEENGFYDIEAIFPAGEKRKINAPVSEPADKIIEDIEPIEEADEPF